MKQPSIDPVKSRVPDIEKALSNWVKNNQRQGLSVSDKDIVEKAIFFARACRCPRDKESMFTATWLKMFKKNHLLFISSRKGSIEVPSRSSSPASVRTLSMSLTTDGSSSMSPPSSPTDAFGSLSSIQSQKCAVDELVDATRGLVNDITSLAEIPCPKSTPGIPFTQRIEPRLPDSAEASRSHSQTAPPLQYDPVLSACWTMDQNDSGADLLPSSPAAVLETSNVMGNLTKPSSTNPGTWTKDTLLPPLDSKFDIALTVNPSGSPTRDEARQALELVLSYFKHHQTGLAPQEYMTFGRIMERLDGTAQIRERDSFACN